MKLAVMDPADRDRELVAHAASECTRLGKGEVMGIRWHTAAHEACLPQDEFSAMDAWRHHITHAAQLTPTISPV
jgi:hypothetical protein